MTGAQASLLAMRPQGRKLSLIIELSMAKILFALRAQGKQGCLRSSQSELRSKKIMEFDYNFQPKNFRSNQGWYSRGYLPHFDGGEISQFITFRLFDSLPQEILEKWREEVLDEKGKIEFRKKIESYLDSGMGSCFLKDRRIAETVQNSLFFYHGKKYNLISWVIMPNHVHCLLLPLKNAELDQITHSIKSFSAQESNKILERKGQFWQHESFDRYVRNVQHYRNVIKYIENNPVKAGLCEKPEDWFFSSAYKH